MTKEEIIQMTIFFLLISYPVGWPVVLKRTYNCLTTLKSDVWTFKSFVYLRQICLLAIPMLSFFKNCYSKIDSFLVL